ncbi:MAG: 4-hydroxybenzoate octaprenyltransferase [Deltaproteobacteria bacterium]|nr:4-hydroxybenzoate octaprenyltransferase [Deltaproteobacteria bacterium]
MAGPFKMTTSGALSMKIGAVSDLIRLPKQQGTLLVLWPTLWSLFIASNGRPSAKLLAIFVLGTFLMRSAGCAVNDIADRDFDKFVERTKARPLASGRLKVKEAVFVFLTLSILAFTLVLFLNPLTIALSVVGIMLASVYPFVKRFSHFPQTVLGMAFGWGAVMAWSAVKGDVGLVPALIFLSNVCWSMAYDTIYALMDKDDDIKIGVKSTALFFGDRVYLALALMYAGFAALMILAGYFEGLGPVYYIGVLIGFIAFLKVVSSVKKSPTREAAYRGFTANAVLGGVILVFIILDMNL